MESTSLMKMDKNTMMERIDAARFPQALNPAEKKMLALVAITYGFDPLMGEITVYQGKPYVSIDGRYRKAQESGIFNGVTSRPATKQEREEWQIPDGDYFVKSTVEIKGGGHFEGWGRVFKAETVGGKGFTPVEKNPQRMAEKRADAQALRKAFHINLPSFEERGIDDDTPFVNIDTGEIIPEKTAVIVDPKKAEQDIQNYYNDTPNAPQATPTPSKPVTPTSNTQPINAQPAIVIPMITPVQLAALKLIQENPAQKAELRNFAKEQGLTGKKLEQLTQAEAAVLLNKFSVKEEI